MAKKHQCEGNDHICKIAEENHFFDYKTIWDDKTNRSLKKKRSNPHILFKGDRTYLGRKGDTVEIPEKKEEKDSKPTTPPDGKVYHAYEVPRNKLQLNLRVLNADFSPVKNAQYELKIEGRLAPYTGKTNDKGEIVAEEIPLTAQRGTLAVRASADDAKKKRPRNEGGPEDAAEAQPAAGAVEGEVPVSWDIKIGRLNPIMEKAPDKWCISGVQQRLNNLAINSGPVDGILGPNTRSAVETFQSMFDLEKDGKPGQVETQPKLEEVHDQNTYIGQPPPKAPTDITPVPANKKLETTPDDIGHVAPDIEGGTFFNTLLIRPEYRISLRLGDIENLFPWDINTKAGRLARLQVLGLFYWPLNHRVAAGTTAKPGNPARLADNGAAYDFIWDYFKQKFCGGGDDAAAEAELEKRLKEWVLQRFDGAGHGTGGELPDPAETDEEGKPAKAADLAQGHFAKIRLPGGWCFLHSDGNHVHNRDPSVGGMLMYDRKYDLEQSCYNVNPALGKIPLIAKVEQKRPGTDEWIPAGGVTVYFQLLRPYDLPDFVNDINRLNSQPNRTSLREGAYSVTHAAPPTRPNTDATSPPVTPRRGGPAYFTHIWENYNVDPDDPQANNCHADCGGKRGNQLAGRNVGEHIFVLGEVDGFSKEHGNPPANVDDEGRGSRVLDPAPSLNEVQVSGDNANHPHAVKTETNDEGEAGVVFMPSRCGGDRYRIRAYVGPPTMTGPGNNGKGAEAVRVDTGTFAIWRNVRISRYVRQRLREADLNTVMINQRYNRADNAAIGANDRRNWMRQFLAVDGGGNWRGLPHHDMHTVSDGEVGHQFDGFRAALARAFCEFEEDPGFAVENLSQNEWDAALKCGLEDAKQVGMQAGPHGLPANIRAVFGPPHNRLNTLFFRDAHDNATDGITVANGFCIPALTARAFSARTGTNILTGPHHLAWKNVVRAILMRYIVPGFMRHIAKNGYLPGVTFIQAVLSTNLGKEPGFRGLGWSGLATHYHGAYVLYGRAAYPIHIGDAGGLSYSYTANATHEMGHVLFSVHAPGNNNHNSCAGGVRWGGHDCTEWHDCHDLLVDNANNITNANFPPGHANAGEPRGNPSHGTCLMSYRRCEGQFCSRCLFQLRGWDTRSAQMRAGDADLPPHLEPVQTQWVREGQQLTIDLNTKDTHGRALAYGVVNMPAGGNIVDNGDGTARFTWTPQSGDAGTHTVTFQVTEAGGGAPVQPPQVDTAVVTIYVLR